MQHAFPPLELFISLKHIRASPPCRAKGTWQAASPLTRPWIKAWPTPLQSRGLDCQGSSNFQLHSLSSRVSVALATPTFRGPIHPLAIQWIVPLLGIMEYSWQFFGLKSQYASNGRGSTATPKNFSACLEPFKAHFESMPFCPRVEML